MEATPGYFEGGGKVASKVYETLGGEAKILIILREPVDRLISFFNYKKSILQISKDLSIEEYIAQCEDMPIEERVLRKNDLYWGVDGGFYANYLSEWFDVFGENLKVMFFDSLKADPKLFMEDVSEWIGIDPSIYGALNLGVENKSQDYKSKNLQSMALKVNEKLEVILRRWPQLKQILRKLYSYLNTTSFDVKCSDKTLQQLQVIYRPYNDKLQKLLKANNYTELPSWLD